MLITWKQRHRRQTYDGFVNGNWEYSVTYDPTQWIGARLGTCTATYRPQGGIAQETLGVYSDSEPARELCEEHLRRSGRFSPVADDSPDVEDTAAPKSITMRNMSEALVLVHREDDSAIYRFFCHGCGMDRRQGHDPFSAEDAWDLDTVRSTANNHAGKCRGVTVEYDEDDA